MNPLRCRLGVQPTLSLVLLLASLMAGQVVAQAATTTENTDTTTAAATTNGATTATDTAAATTGQTTAQTTAQTTDTSSTDSLPPLTTSTSSTDTLPTLTSAATSSTYSIPVATVPPTENAPYMRQSNLPEGTVFIAVGAALGFIGLSVLAWRALVAWSINRSVRRASMEQAQQESKTLLRHKRRSRRHSRHRSHRPKDGTSVSMEKLSPSHRHSHMGASKGPGAQSSLFYSPTAGAGLNPAANRASTYLPAGYYSAGAAAPGGGHSRNLGPSPPGSPSLPPSSGADAPQTRASHLGASSSTVNLNAPPQGRAPSAYLEDLFENHAPAGHPGGT